MSRTMINAIQSIFEILQRHVDSRSQQYIINKQRRISPNVTCPTENAHALENVRIVTVCNFFYKKPVIGLKYINESYILIPETTTLQSNFSNGIIHNVIDNEEIIADGLSLAVLAENHIPVKEMQDLGNVLVDQIFGINSDELYVEYEFKDIARYFTDFQIWKVDSNIFNVEHELDLNRVYSLYLIEEKINGVNNLILLNLNANSLNQIKRLLEEASSSFISDVIFRAITSTHWEHCFLEFYRCIENIYNIYYIDKLRKDLGIDTKQIEQSLEEIGFKSAENINIKNLFKEIVLNMTSVKDLKTALGCQDTDNDDGKIKERAAEKVYDVRCKIAHLKHKHISPNFTQDDWNEIIKNLCDVIIELYNKFYVCLNELCN